MARVQHVRRTIVNDGLASRSDEEVTTKPVATSVESESLAERVVWIIAGLILALLAVRFVFSLLGANRANPIANLVYDMSHPFVAPFFGLFNYNVVDYGASRVEIYTLVAMGVYALLAWLIASLFGLARRDY